MKIRAGHDTYAVTFSLHELSALISLVEAANDSNNPLLYSWSGILNKLKAAPAVKRRNAKGNTP